MAARSRNSDSLGTGRHRSNLTASIVVLAIVAVAFVGLASHVSAQQPNWPGDKISQWVTAHQADKEIPRDISAADHRARLLQKGLNADNLDAEKCALYVHSRLSEAEISALRAQGIIVHSYVWVPPVPGQHPYGFHLATVNYNSLNVIQNDSRFVYLESTEFPEELHNDLAVQMINADDVHAGLGMQSRDGTGVNIGIADSGIDPNHTDLPVPIESFDTTDGTSPADWDTDVTSTKSAHGTHVTGTAVGDGGLSGGQYTGSAPGGNLYFYKVMDDIGRGRIFFENYVEAVNRALAVGCDLFSMSIGGSPQFMDGSDPRAQAFDAAVAGGMVCFVSAGNAQDDGRHFSINVAPNTTSAAFGLSITNPNPGGTVFGTATFRVNWIDGVDDDNMVLAVTNLGMGESLTLEAAGTSVRGTEAREYDLFVAIPANTTNVYNITLQNTAGSGTTPLVHVWTNGGVFNNPDPNFTLGSPALADNVIAVGAWTQRNAWTDFNGNPQNSAWGVNVLAPFSSLGPRIDGLMKPDIVAPGAATISSRDSGNNIDPPNAPLAGNPTRIIDNDGQNLNGTGPANYYVMWGTSMACPLAAGAAALLFEADPTLTPAQVYNILTSTASMANMPDNNVGFGLIDIYEALCTLDTTAPTVFCPSNITIECNTIGGVSADDPQIVAFLNSATATDENDPNPEITNNAPSLFPVGTTEVTFRAEDACGNLSTGCTATVTVEDNIPPEIMVELNRDALWPPNHKMADIMAAVTVTDICCETPTFVLTSVESNEPDNGPGDGNTVDDIQGADIGTPDVHILLRSERSGQGDGRVYTIVYTGEDCSGNTATATVEVRVPHDQSGHALASMGFVPSGMALDPALSQFALVIRSTEAFDATALDVSKTYVGNIKGAVRPERSLELDNDVDQLADLAVFYSARALSVLQDAESIGLHYTSAEGVDYLVPDIFDLGERVPLLTAVVIPRTDEAEDEEQPGEVMPTVTALLPSYPNPFNPSTTIEFHLVEAERVVLQIYDARGTVVRTLVNDTSPAGAHRVVWDGRDGMGTPVATGVYFARFVAGDYQMTRKLVLLK